MKPTFVLTGSVCLLIAGCEPGEYTATADQAVSLPFDARPADGVEMPKAEGADGKLRYADGCLYLEERSGGRVGLIMPDSFRFDGRTLTDGKIAFMLGSVARFSGGWISADDGAYACKNMPMVSVDNAFARPPPKDDHR